MTARFRASRLIAAAACFAAAAPAWADSGADSGAESGAAAGASLSADAAYVERIKAAALDARCGLFDDGAKAALDGGAALARNALLRSGWPEAAVRRLHAEGESRAAALACASPEASATAGRVIDAYQAWRRLVAMDFPGDQRTWSAKRTPGADYAAWLVTQNISNVMDLKATFGLARDADGVIRPALALPASAAPRLAHLQIRDFAVSEHRIGSEFQRFTAPDLANPLSLAAPPDVFTKRAWASGRQRVEKGQPLAAGFDEDVALFWYPAALIDELGALDPREAAVLVVELAPRARAERTERLYVEIGDFAVARLFIELGAQPSGASEEASATGGSSKPAALIR